MDTGSLDLEATKRYSFQVEGARDAVGNAVTNFPVMQETEPTTMNFPSRKYHTNLLRY